MKLMVECRQNVRLRILEEFDITNKTFKVNLKGRSKKSRQIRNQLI